MGACFVGGGLIFGFFSTTMYSYLLTLIINTNDPILS
jgi:hypothetical protein